MSMSSSSILFRQSSRCTTKIPRHSNLVVPSTSSLISSSTLTSAVSQPSLTNSDPTSSTETSLPSETSASDTWHSTALLPFTDAVTTQSPQPPAVVSPVAVPTTTASTTAGKPSNYNLIHTENGPHAHMPVSSRIGSSSHETDSSLYLPSSATSKTSAIPTLRSTESFVAHSTATSPIASANSSSQGHIDQSSHSEHAPLGAILGGVLGGVAFVALALAIGYFVMRHKRRDPRGGLSTGTSEEHLQDEGGPVAPSADSLQGYQSGGSFLSVASSTPSSPLRVALAAPKLAPGHHHSRTLSSLNPVLDSNPFLDSAEVKYVSRGSMRSIAGALRNPFADAPSHSHVAMQQSEMSQRPASAAWYSMHSDRSLGSTLLLPGRSSAGSSLQRLSYPFTVAELESCDPSGPVARLSTRSDPFDLECPPHAMHRRSSTAIPLGQV
ncbi:hypothetical protein BO94DRAFT_370702 [Aspergillus sclerotioniger CBS 115572]|uniref:Uncharacterized protein n=1 Tax=Aspergillus sclerotioniger CBS 115572 TaxID=1450535 RepID=A0A317X3V5_9EURO|nr:hypothetical protein BO94DRAFT_370702 [Aspergillus sclerotioniger CBS 115572]PWY93314.1 hypothetical protein BO94DRAFT_370702 [Aspergillus sclerotioniger CBS 115572]